MPIPPATTPNTSAMMSSAQKGCAETTNFLGWATTTVYNVWLVPAVFVTMSHGLVWKPPFLWPGRGKSLLSPSLSLPPAMRSLQAAMTGYYAATISITAKANDAVTHKKSRSGQIKAFIIHLCTYPTI